MTTITITTIFGRWDEAATQLKRFGTLTVENTVEVPSEKIKAALFELWSLTAAGVIDSFTVKAECIRLLA